MATPENSRPKRGPAVVVVRDPVRTGPGLLRTRPAALVSVLFHCGLIAAMIFLIPGPSQATNRDLSFEDQKKAEEEAENTVVQQDEKLPPETKEPLVIDDIDPAANDFDIKTNYNNDRIEEFSVPGINNPDEPIGILGGDKDKSPFTIHAPPGVGGGQGGYAEAATFDDSGFNSVGMVGGVNKMGAALGGTFYGRSGATREKSLREGGGTAESEACVARGLKWLVRQQATDGRWQLNGDFPDQGNENDIAGTAFGLLPLLAAGYTHLKSKNSVDNPFDKPIEKGLWFLMSKQDKKTGNFGGGMYAHGLATIAMCEAYGLSQDPTCASRRRRWPSTTSSTPSTKQRRLAYTPQDPGDTSVVGWQVMALKSGQMAGLIVPETTSPWPRSSWTAANDKNSEGYGYTGPGATPTMTAVGLLCRQYLQSWGRANRPHEQGRADQHPSTSPPARRRGTCTTTTTPRR